MAENGKNKIHQLRQLYIQYQLLADAFFAAGLAALIWSFGYAFYTLSWVWGILIFLAIYGLSMLLNRWWEVDDEPIIIFLNLKYPDLEESCELVLKDSSTMDPNEKVKLVRVENALKSVPLVQRRFTYRLRLSILFFLVMPIFCWEITWLHKDRRIDQPKQKTSINGKDLTIKK